MSYNQSRGERTESGQYRKFGRSGSNQQRNFSGGGGNRGGGGGNSAAPISSSNQFRSFKKQNSNAQGVQSRASGPSVNADSSNQAAARTSQNGAHQLHPSPGVSDTSVTSAPVKQIDVSAPNTVRAVPRGPSSSIPPASSEISTPATPAKAPGEASRPFSLQFGSISPSLMNGMHIPARTSSAPPNLDEQKRDQARHEASRAAPPALPTPSIPKQQLPKKDAGIINHSNAVEAHLMSKSKRDAQASVLPSGTQTQNPSAHSMPGMPIQMPFHQPQVPLHFIGSSPLQSQAMSVTSVPMAMPMPYAIGNSPVQQPVFVSGLQPHPMQSQGLMHQGQGLNFSSPMGPKLPPQPGNMGINMGPQFPQQQAGKYGGQRKVRITHPDTHEELRLDGSSGPRSRPSVPPQSLPVPPSFQPSHQINYYPNSYSSSPHFFAGPDSLHVNNSQLNPTSQPSRLQVTVKSAVVSHGEKHAARSISSPSVGKVESPNHSKPNKEDSVTLLKDPETSSKGALQQLRSDIGPSFTSVLGTSTQSAVLASISADTLVFSSRSSLGEVPSDVSSSIKREEKFGKLDCVKDQEQKQVDRDPLVNKDQVGGGLTISSNLASQPSEAENAEGNSTASSVIREDLENDRKTSTVTVVASDSYCSISDHALEVEAGDPPKVSNINIKESKQLEPKKLMEVQANLICSGSSILGDRSLTSLQSLSMKPSKDIGHVEERASLGSNKESSSETFEGKLEVPTGICIDDENRVDNVVSSASISVDKDAETCPSVIDVSSLDGNISTSDIASCDLDVSDYKELHVSKSDVSTSVLVPSPSEDNSEHREEVGESKSSDLVSKSSVLSEKSCLEPNATKTALTRGKKKRKDLFKKANAAGATSDLYMAYKGPEESKESLHYVESAENASSDSLKQQISLDVAQEDVTPTEKGLIKLEPDDWEDAADVSTPKLEPPQNGDQVDGESGLMTKKYSRDFLLKFAEQFTDLPEGFEITSDIAEALMAFNGNVSRDSYPNPGRDWKGGSRPERRVSGMGEEEKWVRDPGPPISGPNMQMDIFPGGPVMGFRPGQGGNYGVLRNTRGQMSVQYPAGILPGLMQPHGPLGGLQRNNSDSERWQRGTAYQKGLMPSPHTPHAPQRMMHKSENKYQVGKVTDEEQAKQRQLKAILNKLTPQNFEKLFQQVKEVNIDNVVTLTGVISQIFDKALMEPTFCEMYANFCHHLAAELPDLSVDDEKITFKRLLLNKCQEEFERGEREQEEANKADEEGEVKQSEEQREEKRLQARRRMLGNIRLIGELYKKRMLTERIMHECIKKLLGGPGQIPDEEDIEALCKLMSTIGEMIDHSKAKEHMDAYFDMMAQLSTNTKLSSRVRFMLLDAIDLRKNKWQQRRKVEGPKKIDEVHRDAAQERQAQTSRLARSPSISSSARRGPPMDFASRGSNVLPFPSSQIGGMRAVPPQFRGFGAQDVRFEERHPHENRPLSVPPPQRTDDAITLGPQGGLGRGMSYRGQPAAPSIPLIDVASQGDSRRMGSGLNGYNSIPERAAYGSRDGLMPRYMPERFSSPSIYNHSNMQERVMNYGDKDSTNIDPGLDKTLPASPPAPGLVPTQADIVSSEKICSEERLRDMSLAAIKEFYSAKDENEVVLCIKELNSPSFYSSMVSLWVTDSFERKDMERDLLARLLVNLTNPQHHIINQEQLIKGFESVLETLEDAVNDAPRAAEFLGRILAKVISENVISLSQIAQLIYEGGEEQGRLVEIGLAAEVLGSILESIKSEKGDSILTEIRKGSTLRLENFRPPGSNKSLRIDKFI